MLKLPIARLGKWHHDQYGTVEFTQQDFNDIKKNFEANVRGYEPYLRYGHNQKGAGLHGAEPAQGFLRSLAQKDDVLWGYFEPTNQEVVNEVKSGKYRYGSAEIIRNASDKHTGKKLRIFLKGHTLTNEPFVPNLPRNIVSDEQYLSEVEAQSQFCILTLADQEVPDESGFSMAADMNAGMMHSLMQSMMNLFKRVEDLPTRDEVKAIMTKVEADSNKEVVEAHDLDDNANQVATTPLVALGSTIASEDMQADGEHPMDADAGLSSTSKERTSPDEMRMSEKDPSDSSEAAAQSDLNGLGAMSSSDAARHPQSTLENQLADTQDDDDKAADKKKAAIKGKRMPPKDAPMGKNKEQGLSMADAVDESALEKQKIAQTQAENMQDMQRTMNLSDEGNNMETENEVAQAHSEINDLKARLESIQAERDAFNAAALEAQSALQARMDADATAAEQAAQVAAEQHEVQFAQMLTDRVNNALGKGVPPVLANRARVLVESLRTSVGDEQTLVLSDNAEPVDLVNGIFSLLSEASGVVDFNTHGFMLSDSDVGSKENENPWGDRISGLKNQKAKS